MTAPAAYPRATRVRKARKQSACALCPVTICVGSLIGKLAAGRWAHATCIIGAQRMEQDGGAASRSRDARTP